MTTRSIFATPGRPGRHQTDVFLSIIGRRMRLERELATLALPSRAAIEDLERYARKRPVHYHQALGMQASGRPLRPERAFGVIDYERWSELWQRREVMRRR